MSTPLKLAKKWGFLGEQLFLEVDLRRVFVNGLKRVQNRAFGCKNRSNVHFSPTKKAFSPKKGLVFAVNGASAPPPPAPRPRPPPPSTEIPGGGGFFQERGGGGGPVFRGGGGAEGAEPHLPRKRAPFSAKTPF